MRPELYKPFIYIPEVAEYSVHMGERVLLRKYKLPDDVFFNKIYPTCICGRRYVPVNDTDKSRCFFCNFTNRKEVKIITKPETKMIKCPKCNQYFIKSKRTPRSGICNSCNYQINKQNGITKKNIRSSEERVQPSSNLSFSTC